VREERVFDHVLRSSGEAVSWHALLPPGWALFLQGRERAVHPHERQLESDIEGEREEQDVLFLKGGAANRLNRLRGGVQRFDKAGVLDSPMCGPTMTTGATGRARRPPLRAQRL
jgi:hypothetical protein